MKNIAPVTGTDRRSVRHALAAPFALAAAGLILSGCTAAASDNDATAECPDGTTTLTVLRAVGTPPSDAQLDLYQEANACVEFSVTEVPFQQFSDKLAVSLSSANPPDILMVDSPSTNALASQSALLDLTDYLPEGYQDDVNHSDLIEASYEGGVYSLPLVDASLTMYVNRTLTDAAGIEVPTTIDAAWTWNELRDAALACQATAGADVFGLAPSQLGNPAGMYRDLLMLRTAGDPDGTASEKKTFAALADDGQTVDGYLNSPEAVEAAEFFQSLYVGDDAITSATPSPSAFVNGKACFDLTIAPFVGDLAALPFEGGVTPVPYIQTPIVHTGATNIGVSARSKNADLAAEAAVFMGTDGAAVSAFVGDFAIPSLESVQELNPETLSDPVLGLAHAQVEEWGMPRPVTIAYSAYDLHVSQALSDIAKGADPRTALDEAVARLDKVLGEG